MAGLHVGADAEKIVVALQPLRMRTGRGRNRYTGQVTELVALPPNGYTTAHRNRTVGRLAAVVAVLALVLSALGIPWWLTTAVGALLVGRFAREQARAAEPGLIAVPSIRLSSQVITALPDRVTFERCLAVARRIRGTWAHLRHMIDPATAELQLDHALWELAGVLARRQEIRRLRDDLLGVRLSDLPADSPAVRALREQAEHVEALWREVDADVELHATALRAIAQAGETFIHELRVNRTAHQTRVAVAQLTATRVPSSADAGQALADRTAAVLAAYRELESRYGSS